MKVKDFIVLMLKIAVAVFALIATIWTLGAYFFGAIEVVNSVSAYFVSLGHGLIYGGTLTLAIFLVYLALAGSVTFGIIAILVIMLEEVFF